MSNILTISLPSHLDEVKISEFLSSETPIEIEILNLYANQISTANTVSVYDFSPAEISALILLLDKFTGTFELGTYIFSIAKSEKTFDLSKSFVRNSIVIPKPPEQLPNGTTLLARFEIPGFELNTFREIPLYYNSGFNPADLLLLEEIGITITGNGLEFTISNEIDCKVSFSKPETSEVEYIIDFPLFNEIIPADE